MKRKQRDIPPLDLRQEAVLAELAGLRRLLAEADKPSEATGDDGLVLLRPCPDITLTQWEILSRGRELRDWLALPLTANPLPWLTHIQETLRELTFLSEHDPLTKLTNRGAFQRILEAECLRAARAGQSLSLALLDLDDFKAINDTRGHPCGDLVLMAFASLLAADKRAYDTAARVGGEEFGLILPGLGLTRSQAVVTRLLEATRGISVLCDGQDIPVRLTASAGLACTKGKIPVSANDLFAQADKALYQAKTSGKDRLVAAPIADLTAPPEASLVRADEKRFLFTGTTKG